VTIMNILEFEQFAEKRPTGRRKPSKQDTSGLEAMLDYAIVEGAQMRLPLFVCLLRLARMALKEETDQPKPEKR
jgi:hypothetical protein